MRLLLIVLSFFIVEPVLAGGSRYFDGTNDSISLGDLDNMDNATLMSCGAWVKFDVDTSDDTVISNYNNAAVNAFILWRDDVDSAFGRTDTFTSFLAESASSETARAVAATGSAPKGVWINVATTIQLESATGLNIYVNGVLDANSPVNISTISQIDGGATVTSIGESEITTFDHAGNIAYAYCFTDRVLNAQQVNEMMWRPCSIPGAEFCLPLWGVDSPEVDLSGNNRTGTVAGAVESSDGPPVLLGDSGQ